MQQARRDLRAAEHLLEGAFAAHATVFAHLAVEKALKALHRAQKGPPPVTHDLRVLADRIDLAPISADRRDAIEALAEVSVLCLYAPDDVFGHPVGNSPATARERVADARLLVGWLRSRVADRSRAKR